MRIHLIHSNGAGNTGKLAPAFRAAGYAECLCALVRREFRPDQVQP